jgi:2-polyprenyl-6-hydroxyphenyl methylase/3-demethylubiquinone-9 3-methyltransferase
MNCDMDSLNDVPAGASASAELAPYSEYHRRRFDYLISRVTDVLPRGAHIMDLGSHLLDQAVRLIAAGYSVHGFDAAVFAEAEPVRAKAEKHGIALSTVHDLSLGRFGEDLPDSAFDALVFTEILEHLAFNPLLMWKAIVRLMKPGAFIFITTPNGVSMRRRIRDGYRLLLGKSKGIPLDQIFHHATYGHHWKEYGPGEIIEYFEKIGFPRSHVEITRYSYVRAAEIWPVNKLRAAAVLLTDAIPSFRGDLFIVAKVPDPKPVVPDPPGYI